MQTQTEVRVGAEAPLTAEDRCDKCGGQAYIRATMLVGELLFCRHDWNAPGVEEKMRSLAVVVHDETWKLTYKPKPVDLED